MSREEPVIEGGVEGGGSPFFKGKRTPFVERGGCLSRGEAVHDGRRPLSREEVVRRLMSGTWMWWEGRKEEQWISALGNSKVNMIT